MLISNWLTGIKIVSLRWDILLMQICAEKYLIQVRRPTYMKCLTSYKHSLRWKTLKQLLRAKPLSIIAKFSILDIHRCPGHALDRSKQTSASLLTL